MTRSLHVYHNCWLYYLDLEVWPTFQKLKPSFSHTPFDGCFLNLVVASELCCLPTILVEFEICSVTIHRIAERLSKNICRYSILKYILAQLHWIVLLQEFWISIAYVFQFVHKCVLYLSPMTSSEVAITYFFCNSGLSLSEGGGEGDFCFYNKILYLLYLRRHESAARGRQLWRCGQTDDRCKSLFLIYM